MVPRAWLLGRGRLEDERFRVEKAGSVPDDEVARRGEPADVTDDRHERGRGRVADSRDGHEPPDVFGVKSVNCDVPLDQLDLGVQEVDLSEAGIDRLAFVDRELQLRQPRATLAAVEIRRRGAALELRCRTAWISSLALVRCLTSCALLEMRRLKTRVGSSPAHTSGKKPAAKSWTNVRASILSVLTLALVIALTALALASTTRSTCGSRMRTMGSALPVTSRHT